MLVVAETKEKVGKVFSAYGTLMMVVPLFKYLGLMM